jgi:hypothetical protein
MCALRKRSASLCLSPRTLQHSQHPISARASPRASKAHVRHPSLVRNPCKMPCTAMATCSKQLLLWPSSVSHSSSSSHAHISCSASTNQPTSQQCGAQSVSLAGVRRRELLLGGVAAGLVLSAGSSAEAYTQVEVGAFLPPAVGESGFVQFVASPKDTPALRAGR